MTTASISHVREDDIRVQVVFFWGELVGEDIRLSVLRTKMVGDSEIKLPKKQGPACLAGVEAFGGLDVGQIFMVIPDNERLLSPLKPVPTLFQG